MARPPFFVAKDVPPTKSFATFLGIHETAHHEKASHRGQFPSEKVRALDQASQEDFDEGCFPGTPRHDPFRLSPAQQLG